MADAGVEFAQVNYTLDDGRTLLSDISLALKGGTTTALLGRSGSGKTTLLRTVNALVRVTSGRVLVAGRDVATEDPIVLRRGIGYVIQESGLFPHLTVECNIGMTLELVGRSRAEIAARVREVLGLVGLPEEVLARSPRQLSGGQRQRVGFARALAGDPAVLLMDEPFGALDPLTRGEMQEMLLGLLGRVRKTVLLVTHALDEAIYLSDRVVLLDAGRVLADLRADEVLASGNEAMQRYVAAVHRTAPPPLDGPKRGGKA